MINTFFVIEEAFSLEKYLIRLDAPQVPPYEPAAIAHGLTAPLAQLLFPLLVELDSLVDKRLVRTFLQTMAVMLTLRDRASKPLTQWQQAGQQGWVLWDESGWEKPESLHLED